MLQVSCAVCVVDLATAMMKLIRFRNVRECSMSFPRSSLRRRDGVVAVKARRLQRCRLCPREHIDKPRSGTSLNSGHTE